MDIYLSSTNGTTKYDLGDMTLFVTQGNTQTKAMMVILPLFIIILCVMLLISCSMYFTSGSNVDVNADNNDNKNIEKYNPKTKQARKTKFHIYHMRNCGHCNDIMKNKNNDDGMTKFEKLKKKFENNENVEILDYELGKDPEASKYRAFPVLTLTTKDGEEIEYEREREVEQMEQFIRQYM